MTSIATTLDPVRISEARLGHVNGKSQHVVLDDLTLSIPAGVCVALVGPSGSGKSTLLHTVAGLKKPLAGTVTTLGVDVGATDAPRLAWLRATQVGMVFQAFHLLGHLTALENVALKALIAGADRRAAREEAASALERVGLAHRSSHYPYQLSGGEQQRVGVARAIVNQPRLVLADEPTGNLDSKTTGLVADLLAGLAEDGRTVVIATHDESVAAEADSRIVIGS
ncbi:MAG: ABC transporter ATP-binding protein [Coriobacteriia bacterium]